MTARRAVVTGAGPRSIGRAVADALVAEGWDVAVTRRADLDLTDRGSVAAFAASYAERADHLDLLVNSAGIHLDLGSRWTEPRLVDGLEIHWRTNYLGTVDLTTALLPLLLAAPAPTVLHVVSQLHERGTTAQLLGQPVAYDSWASYGTSKLGLVHHAALLADRYADHGLRALAVHPGAVSTNIADRGLETRPLLRRLRNLALPLERRTLMSPEESAAHLIRIATDPAAESGYYRKSRRLDPAPAACDVEARTELALATEAWLRG
ncbi:SDR family NAD(P)-dependent oxidoreductase [Nocardioides nitrophenolicus]|uniref:SDR family NAD(P)-dependent oxidoreductase n=1 Tax=Nocardioides nitrophenolicus TaxID=60489 RepID=UPI00195989D8|nr:SDR family NAD(P)-dependent oxidoreductase [Nocardioides nitrophenolicus]MBM7518017.1 NAD(P)-dependent dehydrogenase (short-subunit alcohol dehydrogenase family) [Nocardioides nitrophenolicus]